MAKQPTIEYADFLKMVDPGIVPQVQEMHACLVQNGCSAGITEAKSGFVVSYRHGATKKVVANFVFRKKGLLLRIYADHIVRYAPLVEALPETMQQALAKAPVCKRLVNPSACSPKCSKGYEFMLNGAVQQKCRYGCFQFFVTPQEHPHLMQLLREELAGRAA